MYSPKSANRLLSLLLTLLLLTPALVTTRQASAASTDQNDDAQLSLTIDSLLGAETYMLYGELRNVGAQAQAGGLMSLVEPVIPLLGGVPKELMGITTFISKHSNTLARARMIIAAMPVKPELPQVVLAIELASPDAAEQFEPEFRQFLSSVIGEANKRLPSFPPSAQHGNKPPPLAIKRAGALLIVTEAEFDITTIRPDEGNLLSSSLSFQAARNRFYSEPLFIYFDVGLSGRALKQRYGADTGDDIPPPEPIRISEPESPVALPAGEPPVIKHSPPSQDSRAAAKPSQRRPRKSRAAAQPGKSKADQPDRARSRTASGAAPSSAKPADTETGEQQDSMSSAIMPFLIGGNSIEKNPDALAIALAYEADALIVRILIAREPGVTAFAIPFISMLACGSPVAPEGASYVPADTEVFLTASVDLPAMFDLITATTGGRTRASRQQDKGPTDAAVSEMEKKLGAKIKDELIAALGSEVAFGLPMQTFLPGPLIVPAQGQTGQTPVVMLISVQNKEVVKSKILPVLELLGLRARGEKGVTEKRGVFEISAYNKVAVAFMNNFLVLTSDLPAMRRVVDAVATNRTLAATKDYHDYMRWQPRQTLAQVYVSSEVIKSIYDGVRQSEALDDDMKRFFTEVHFVAEPITYSATSDASGPVYELRLPKGFIAMLLAQLNSTDRRAQVFRNEHTAMFALENIKEAQLIYRNEKGRYATLEELVEAGALEKEALEGFGYKFDVRVAGGRYEALATPTEYGKTGLASFYMDESGVIRAGDHGGRPATPADKPLTGNPSAK